MRENPKEYPRKDELPKTEVHTSLKKMWLQVIGWWRRSMDCLGQCWSSVTGQVENKPPRHKWAVGGGWACRSCQDVVTGLGSKCAVSVLGGPCEGHHWPASEDYLLWVCGWGSVPPHPQISTLLINHATEARTNTTCTLYTWTEKRSPFLSVSLSARSC